MPAVGLAVFAAPSAHAQTAPSVTAIQSPVLRFDSNQKESATRNGIPVNVVNYDDCESGRTYEFNLSIQNPSAPYTLVAYAGSGDCTYYPARTGSSATCFPVGTISATATTASVNVSMNALTGIVFRSSSNTTSTGDVCTLQPTPTGSSTTIWFFFVDQKGYALGTAEAYPITVDTVVQGVSDSALQAVLSTGDQSLTVSVPFSDDSDTVSWNIYYTPHAGQEQPVNSIPFDAGSNNGVCPDAATPDSATSQEASTPVDASEDAPTEAAATEGGPLPNNTPLDDGSVSDASSEAGDDAATTPDASSPADAGTTTTDSGPATGSVCGTGVAEAGVSIPTNSCVPSDVLRSGGVSSSTTTVDAGDGGSSSTTTTTYKGTPTQPSAALNALLIESVAIGTTSVTIPALKDGYYYLVGVAAVDGAGNVGPLAVACAQPNPPVDFYSVYRGSGGLAGGGYCSTEGPGADVPATTSLALLGLASLAAVFRKRRRTP